MLSAHPRDNVFAVDVNTGRLLDWNPQVNFLTINDLKIDEVNDVVYLAGWDSQTAKHFKAFDGTTGDPVDGWEHVFDGDVYTIGQNNETGIVYIGRSFSMIDGISRNGMAAFDEEGNLLPFHITPDNDIRLIVISEDHSLIYIAGDFDAVNNTGRLRTAAVDLNGQLSEWNPELSSLVPRN